MPPSRSSRTVSARPPSAGPSSSSSRQIPARSRGARPSSGATSGDLPIYEAPLAGLTRSAQHQLSTLPIKHDLSSLQSRLADAHERLASAAADMHEMKTTRIEMAGVRAEKRRERGEAVDPADDARLHDLVRRVDAMTERIEREVRATVDREARMEDAEEALRELSANQGRPPRRGAAPGATQSTFASATGVSQDPTPTQMTTDPDESEAAPTVGVVEALKTRLTDAEENYHALTMRERYSAHNSYVAFRRMLHSAQYPDDAAAPPVPHAHTWFDEARGEARHLKPSGGNEAEDASDGSGPAAVSPSMHPPPSLPARRNHAGDEGEGEGGEGDADDADDSDREIEAVAERTSIRCPLTLQPMQQPVSSSKCPHSFERSAILEYLTGGSTAGNTRRGARAARCPVCEVLLTAADLHVDRVLQRKIRRIQEAEARRKDAEEDEDEDEDEDGAGTANKTRAQLIGSSSPVRAAAAFASSSAKSAKRIKAERMSGVRRGQAMELDD